MIFVQNCVLVDIVFYYQLKNLWIVSHQKIQPKIHTAVATVKLFHTFMNLNNFHVFQTMKINKFILIIFHVVELLVSWLSSIFILIFSFIELIHKIRFFLYYNVSILSLAINYCSYHWNWFSQNWCPLINDWNHRIMKYIKIQLQFSYNFPLLTMLTCMFLASSILVLIPKLNESSKCSPQ